MYGDREGERNILPKFILVYEKENYQGIKWDINI